MIRTDSLFALLRLCSMIIAIATGTGCFNGEGPNISIAQNQDAGENLSNQAHVHEDHGNHDGHDHAHDDHAGHNQSGHHPNKTSTVTVWSDRFEIFMEHPFIVAKTPAEFVTHITERQTFQPRREGPVTFVLSDESGSSTRHVEPSPQRDGIYIPELTFPQPGSWRMSLIIVEHDNEHVVDLPSLTVYGSQDEADRVQPPEEVAGISFLKEQQWKIPFETKSVQRRSILSQDTLAIPESAIVNETGSPVAFVHLSGETFGKRHLTLGEKEDGYVRVVAGLAESEYIVTQGAHAVAETEQHKAPDDNRAPADHDHQAHGDHPHQDHDTHDHEVSADHEGHDDSIVTLSDVDMQRFDIEVDKVKPGNLELHIRVPGEIVINSDRLAHIVPRVSGIVQNVTKNLGDPVKSGEVMAVIESRELADIKAAYLTSVEAHQLAEPYFKREEKLWKKKISSEQEYLDAKKALSEATIEMNKAKYKLRALGFSLDYIENLPTEPSRLFTAYKITAPFDGTIIEKHLTLGEVVREDDDIFVVAGLDTVWVDLRIPQKDASSIKKGQKVTISGKADTTEVEGTIDYVHPLVDEQTRTKLARVVLDNTSGRFLPGTFVTAIVLLEACNTDMFVSKSVLQDINDQTCVFVQNDKGFEPRPVVIGRSNAECVEIVRGLEPGETIVTKNSFRLKAQLEKTAAGEHAGHGHSH